MIFLLVLVTGEELNLKLQVLKVLKSARAKRLPRGEASLNPTGDYKARKFWLTNDNVVGHL